MSTRYIRLFFITVLCCVALHSRSAISFVASTTATCACASGGSTITINVPAGVANNDLMIAHITARLGSGYASYTDLPAPAGWTQLDMLTNWSSQVVTFLFYKIAGASEPGSYGFTDNSVVLLDRVGAIVA